jgi:undecaprenyl diphosphate synthase
MAAAPPTVQDPPVVPRHVAIIMDGNGRWAAQRKLPRAAGHRRGAQAAKDAVMTALDLGIEYLTLYSFSSENWNRSAEEVGDLMGLLRYTMQQEEKNLTKLGVRLRVIGDRERLPADILSTIDGFEGRSAENTRLTVVVALSYGSRAEIAHAARRLAEQAARGEIDPSAIDEAAVAANLYTSDIPDPDLLIRTSGELRISNFLLWQLAYSEFVFTDAYWPDFGKEAFTAAVRSFGSRERRFGGRRSG